MFELRVLVRVQSRRGRKLDWRPEEKKKVYGELGEARWVPHLLTGAADPCFGLASPLPTTATAYTLHFPNLLNPPIPGPPETWQVFGKIFIDSTIILIRGRL